MTRSYFETLLCSAVHSSFLLSGLKSAYEEFDFLSTYLHEGQMSKSNSLLLSNCQYLSKSRSICLTKSGQASAGNEVTCANRAHEVGVSLHRRCGVQEWQCFCQKRLDLRIRARSLEFGQPHFGDTVCRSRIDDILDVLLEIADSASRCVPMEGNKVNFAISCTGGEELVQPVNTRRWTCADGVRDSG